MRKSQEIVPRLPSVFLAFKTERTGRASNQWLSKVSALRTTARGWVVEAEVFD